MGKLILICGKICSGKTTYAKHLLKTYRAVLLSCDEILLALFGQNLGDKHDEMVNRTKQYLLHKSLEILSTGGNVILDFGFWQKSERESTTLFFKQHGILPEWHYIDVTDSVWKQNIQKRNKAIMAQETADYFIDDGLMQKFEKLFEPPAKDEVDVWYTNN